MSEHMNLGPDRGVSKPVNTEVVRRVASYQEVYEDFKNNPDPIDRARAQRELEERAGLLKQFGGVNLQQLVEGKIYSQFEDACVDAAKAGDTRTILLSAVGEVTQNQSRLAIERALQEKMDEQINTARSGGNVTEAARLESQKQFVNGYGWVMVDYWANEIKALSEKRAPASTVDGFISVTTDRVTTSARRAAEVARGQTSEVDTPTTKQAPATTRQTPEQAAAPEKPSSDTAIQVALKRAEVLRNQAIVKREPDVLPESGDKFVVIIKSRGRQLDDERVYRNALQEWRNIATHALVQAGGFGDKNPESLSIETIAKGIRGYMGMAEQGYRNSGRGGRGGGGGGAGVVDGDWRFVPEDGERLNNPFDMIERLEAQSTDVYAYGSADITVALKADLSGEWGRENPVEARVIWARLKVLDSARLISQAAGWIDRPGGMTTPEAASIAQYRGHDLDGQTIRELMSPEFKTATGFDVKQAWDLLEGANNYYARYIDKANKWKQSHLAPGESFTPFDLKGSEYFDADPSLGKAPSNYFNDSNAARKELVTQWMSEQLGGGREAAKAIEIASNLAIATNVRDEWNRAAQVGNSQAAEMFSFLEYRMKREAQGRGRGPILTESLVRSIGSSFFRERDNLKDEYKKDNGNIDNPKLFAVSLQREYGYSPEDSLYISEALYAVNDGVWNMRTSVMESRVTEAVLRSLAEGKIRKVEEDYENLSRDEKKKMKEIYSSDNAVLETELRRVMEAHGNRKVKVKPEDVAEFATIMRSNSDFPPIYADMIDTDGIGSGGWQGYHSITLTRCHEMRKHLLSTAFKPGEINLKWFQDNIQIFATADSPKEVELTPEEEKEKREGRYIVTQGPKKLKTVFLAGIINQWVAYPNDYGMQAPDVLQHLTELYEDAVVEQLNRNGTTFITQEQWDTVLRLIGVDRSKFLDDFSKKIARNSLKGAGARIFEQTRQTLFMPARGGKKK